MSDPASTCVVQTRGLTKLYGDGNAVHALDGVDLCIQPGEFVAIVGPSGSGKSTLLNMLGALDKPTSGEVFIDGNSLNQVKDLDRFRSRTVGFVFQTHNLIPTLTAIENIEVPMHETQPDRSARRQRSVELLQLVGLGERMGFLPNQLSGGERQRVAFARALANRPSIVLADEPTGNLDSKNTQEILALMADLNRTQGTTLIVVTHNHEVARETRRVITLRDGRIQSDVAVRSAFDSDLMDLKASALGHAILNGDPIPQEVTEVAPALRRLLERI